MRRLFIFILKLFGWSYELTVEVPDKCVICVAPHTSNWDYVVGMLFYLSVIGKTPHVLMKKELFIFPLNRLFKSMGGIPVDRGKNTLVSDQMVELFKLKNRLQLAIAPEGTRKKTARWKTGFYHIAVNACVPIALAYIDYSKKVAGFNKIFYPTGDYKTDIEEIQRHYKDVKAKYPDRFATNINPAPVP